MKTNQLIVSTKFLGIFLFSSLLFTACNDDDEVIKPAYVGTWQLDLSYSLTSSLDNVLPPSYKIILNLEESTYTRTQESLYLNSENWVVSSGEKGTIQPSGDILKITQKQDSERTYDDAQNVTGITYVDIPEAEQESFNVKWSVTDNTLTIIIDDNEDGDYNDIETGDDSKTVYSKI